MGRIPYLKRLEQENSKDIEIVKAAMQITDTLRFANRSIQELSSGEKQMVIVAKALAQEPTVIFLDEPTSHLDVGHQVRILNLLRRLNKEKGITIITVLHELNIASEYCDRIILLDQGKLSTIGTPAEVLTYQNIETVYKTIVIVNKNPLSGKPHILLAHKEKS